MIKIPNNLRTLDLSNNQISIICEFQGEYIISGYCKLIIINLYLNSNKIKKIENLHINSCRLEISNNYIKKIENIPTSIKWLDLSNNRIKIIRNFNYNNLKILLLYNNNIRNLCKLLDSLKVLIIWNNKLYYKIKCNIYEFIVLQCKKEFSNVDMRKHYKCYKKYNYVSKNQLIFL